MATMAKKGVELGPPPAKGMNMKAASPVSMRESAYFIGVEGCRSPSLSHMVAKMPEKTMMKMGLMDPTQAGLTSKPPKVRLSRWSE